MEANGGLENDEHLGEEPVVVLAEDASEEGVSELLMHLIHNSLHA